MPPARKITSPSRPGPQRTITLRQGGYMDLLEPLSFAYSRVVSSDSSTQTAYSGRRKHQPPRSIQTRSVSDRGRCPCTTCTWTRRTCIILRRDHSSRTQRSSVSRPEWEHYRHTRILMCSSNATHRPLACMTPSNSTTHCQRQRRLSSNKGGKAPGSSLALFSFVHASLTWSSLRSSDSCGAARSIVSSLTLKPRRTTTCTTARPRGLASRRQLRLQDRLRLRPPLPPPSRSYRSRRFAFTKKKRPVASIPDRPAV
ncbi:hypothetical protein GGX14DRAFT_432217 [Mycena pura]|uniref:Uncharacterized protein n=1 Tax=Mycena pura TaxID=153505 RepID=A0AAD6VUV1_9AGAR|nr:hypothetical protein GGX14DRAFT_432217 [Mycena pura]